MTLLPSPSTWIPPLNSAATVGLWLALHELENPWLLPSVTHPWGCQLPAHPNTGTGRLVQPVPVYMRREVGSVPFSFSSLPKRDQGDLPAMTTESQGAEATEHHNQSCLGF